MGSFILPNMNNPKVLQNIAEKTRQFDRTHFDDDVPVAIDALLANHERLPTDRKLITRLRPRHAVALGFFEGYAKAVEDIASKSPETHDIGIVIKPPPPPPPAAPPIPNELSVEIDDDLAQAAAKHANDDNGFPTMTTDRDEVCKAMKTGRGWYAAVRAYVRGAQWQRARIEIAPPPAPPPIPNELSMGVDDSLVRAAANHANEFYGYESAEDDMGQAREALTYENPAGWSVPVQSFVRGALWQRSTIENAHAGDEPTTHFPPAFDRASMPSDREIVEFAYRTIYPDSETSESAIQHAVDALNGDDPESIRRKVLSHCGSVAEACAIKFAFLHFRDRVVGPVNRIQDAERTQYEMTIAQKNERIAELEKQLDCTGPAEKDEGVVAKLELKIKKQNDLLRLQTADLDKASSRIDELEKQLGDELENLNNIARENVKLANEAIELRDVLTEYFRTESRSDASWEVMRNHLRSLVGLSPIQTATPISEKSGSGELYIENGSVMFRGLSGQVTEIRSPEREIEPIVFRDDTERDYWEEMSFVLANKTNTTSQSVATAVDEMVEERRKRLPKEDVDSDWLIEFAKRTGSESLAMTPEQMWTDVAALVPESTTPSQVRTMLDRAWRLSASVPRRASEMSKPTNDITDELLLEAAQFANKENNDPEHDSDVASARESIALSATDAWSMFVRGYVNGARRSSCKS